MPCSLGDILPRSSSKRERPPHTKGRLTPSLFIFSHNIHYNERTGQGEARTLVSGGGAPEEHKQMFFDDYCREGKSSVESRLVKRSLVEAVPP